MFEILSRVKIDKDLWIFDEDDFAISEYNRTGDISGIKKNEALSAIAGRLSNRSYAGINSPLIASLEASVEEYNKEEALKKKKALAALGDSGAF